MNNGAYGCYPRQRKTRFLYGRHSRWSKALRKVDPKYMYSRRKTQVGRLFKTDMQTILCTWTEKIVLPTAGSNTYQFGSTANTYSNLTNMLVNSPEFVSRQTQYSYYRLNGVKTIFTRQWIDPIAFGTNGGQAGFLATTYNLGMAMLSINLYPNLLTTVVGQPVEDADSSFKVSPYLQGGQTHYIPFPRNFTTGTNSNGLGVWNACIQVANLQGQFSIYNNPSTATLSNQGYMNIWDLEVNFYIQFCNNTGA